MSVPIAPVACDLRTLLTPPFLYFEFVPPKTGYLGLLSLTRVNALGGTSFVSEGCRGGRETARERPPPLR